VYYVIIIAATTADANGECVEAALVDGWVSDFACLYLYKIVN